MSYDTSWVVLEHPIPRRDVPPQPSTRPSLTVTTRFTTRVCRTTKLSYDKLVYKRADNLPWVHFWLCKFVKTRLCFYSKSVSYDTTQDFGKFCFVVVSTREPILKALAARGIAWFESLQRFVKVCRTTQDFVFSWVPLEHPTSPGVMLENDNFLE